jgi:circadian clock protein KaiB
MSRSATKPPRASRPAGARGGAQAAAPTADSEETRRQLEQAARDQKEQRYLLRLYVTGTTPGSTAAIQRVRSICEEHLQGRYELEVFDIYQMPALAKDQQIIAAPTLIKVLPAPLRRFIGDLSKVEKILFGLDLREKS